MRTKEYDFEVNQIVMFIFLTTYEHGPTTKSWKELMRKAFEERYKSISFKKGIVDWLESLMTYK